MRREPPGNAEADNARTAIHHGAGLGDCRGEFCRQIAAITAANDVNAGARGNAGFKSQANNDDHVIPTLNSRSKYQGKLDPAIAGLTAAAKPTRQQPCKPGLTLGHDRRWRFALADLRTGGKAQHREDHCGSNGDFLHGAPIPINWTSPK
jgi:hypothetical protein